MKIKILFIAIALFVGLGSYGQVSITDTTPITQNFNGLSSISSVTWTNNTTPLPGWYSSITTLNLNNGTTNTNAVYNCGAASNSDRALGAISTSTPHNFGIRLKNNNANAINSLSITFNGEQWRQNAANQTLIFEYQIATTITSITAGTWTAVTTLDFVSLNTGTAGALDGNLPANRTAKSATITLNIPTGSEIMLRWNKAGTNSHLLAIDDLSITPTFVPSSDTTAPTVSTLNPLDNATGVAVATNLVATFSENIVIGTGNLLIKKSSDNSTVQTIDVTSGSVTISGATVTINPPSDLVSTTVYYIEIPNTAFKDAAGNFYAGMSGVTTWNFTTSSVAYALGDMRPKSSVFTTDLSFNGDWEYNDGSVFV